jgi:hypothetical protein
MTVVTTVLMTMPRPCCRAANNSVGLVIVSVLPSATRRPRDALTGHVLNKP